jgi:hypothetical protein
VNAGADQTFTITPNNGYEIQDVAVDGVSMGAISSYSFNDVSADHSIVVTFQPAQKRATVSRVIFWNKNSMDLAK